MFLNTFQKYKLYKQNNKYCFFTNVDTSGSKNKDFSKLRHTFCFSKIVEFFRNTSQIFFYAILQKLDFKSTYLKRKLIIIILYGRNKNKWGKHYRVFGIKNYRKAIRDRWYSVAFYVWVTYKALCWFKSVCSGLGKARPRLGNFMITWVNSQALSCVNLGQSGNTYP